MPGSDTRIGQFKAFWYGLPSVFNSILFYAVMILIPAAFFWPVISQWRKKVGWAVPTLSGDELSPDLKLWHRMLCVLLAYIFLISPELFHQLARADIAYADLCTMEWGCGNRTISYLYDANGSMVQKTTETTMPQETLKIVTYDYNHQNRLERVTTTPYSGGNPGASEVVDYQYNPQGIRISKDVDGTATDYLIDPYNHTGYAQVLQETTDSTVIYYTIGDDVLAQTTDGVTDYLLYDGHGSTRQLVNNTGAVIDDSEHGGLQSYSYDAYGVMLGGNPTSTASKATNLLYSGEQFDTNAQQYYLRARYYNQNNGTFNRVEVLNDLRTLDQRL